jgi:glycosyltransferase involved in cell wall biosynthesis
MNILHITPHLGGGVGSVLLNWLSAVKNHSVVCLDYANDKAKARCQELGVRLLDRMDGKGYTVACEVEKADVVVVHYWDHPMLPNFMRSIFSLKDYRGRPKFVLWCHKNYPVDAREIEAADLFVATSPIVFDQPSLREYSRYTDMRYIWSSSGPESFAVLPVAKHGTLNIGYVGTVDFKKVSERFLLLLHEIGLAIPEAGFIIAGEDNVSSCIRYPWVSDPARFSFVGKVDDVASVLERLDIFIYPLRPDHYGTCEQAIGEAMAAGLPVVCFDNPCERSIIRHGVDGYLCLNEKTFVQRVEYLAARPWLRKSMGNNARMRALELYSTGKMVNAWEAIFEEVTR